MLAVLLRRCLCCVAVGRRVDEGGHQRSAGIGSTFVYMERVLDMGLKWLLGWRGEEARKGGKRGEEQFWLLTGFVPPRGARFPGHMTRKAVGAYI